jgi:hypothetical protein
MGRLTTSFALPPVRLSRANARATVNSLQTNVPQTAHGADSYQMREGNSASVPIKLTIQSNAGPNSAAAQMAAKPIGRTQRKRGYPPIVTLPTNTIGLP